MNKDGKKAAIIMNCITPPVAALSALFPFLLPVTFIYLVIACAYLTLRKMPYCYAFTLTALTLACVLSGGDIVTVFFTVLTVCGPIAVIAGLKTKGYIFGAGICGLVFVLLASLTAATAFISGGKKSGDFMSDYVAQATLAEPRTKVFNNTALMRFLAKAYYDGYKEEGYQKFKKADEGYFEESVRIFAEKGYEYGENDLFYDIFNFAAIGGILSFLALTVLGRDRRKSPYTQVKEMRLDKRFALFVALPVFAFSFLGFIKILKPTVSAAVNALLTVPAAFAGLTLFYHTASRISGKAVRYALFASVALLGIACVPFSLVRVIVSVFGLADALIDVRGKLDYALGKKDTY